jgi:simple sugar transport system permease protein
MLTSNSTSADPNSIGLFIELDAILAVVIGGTSLAGGRFSLAGTLIGAFIIETMDAFVVIAISARSTDVFKACVVIVVCLLQSSRVRAWLLNVLRWGRPPSRPRRKDPGPKSVPPAPDGATAPTLTVPDLTIGSDSGSTGGPGSQPVKAKS